MDLTIRDHGNSSYQPINIKKVEEHYDAKFIGDFCLKTVREGWSETPLAIFYANNPDVSQGHTHYFGVFVRDGLLYITKGDSAFEEPITGIIADNGEVVFSRYRHDFTYSTDQSVWIDGGRDYCRSSIPKNGMVQLTIDKDKLVIIPGSQTHCSLSINNDVAE